MDCHTFGHGRWKGYYVVLQVLYYIVPPHEKNVIMPNILCMPTASSSLVKIIHWTPTTGPIAHGIQPGPNHKQWFSFGRQQPQESETLMAIFNMASSGLRKCCAL